MKATCPICGHIFISQKYSRIYCCKTCYKTAQKIRYEKKRRKAPDKTLDQIAKEADACGLSYGKYKLQLKLGKNFEELKAAYDVKKAGD